MSKIDKKATIQRQKLRNDKVVNRSAETSTENQCKAIQVDLSENDCNDDQMAKGRAKQRNALHNQKIENTSNSVEYERTSNVDSDSDDVIQLSLMDLRKLINLEVTSAVTTAFDNLQNLLADRFDDLIQNQDSLKSALLDASAKTNTLLLDNTKFVNDLKTINLTSGSATSMPPVNADTSSPNDLHDAALIQSTIEELRCKEEKKANVIIFNIPESAATNAADRKAADITTYTDICKAIDVEQHPIVNIYRIGIKKDGMSRPLVVKSNIHTRKEILLNAKKLRLVSDDASFKRAVLKPDLTREEQKDEKKLVAELKNRRALGEKVFIRRGKIETSNY